MTLLIIIVIASFSLMHAFEISSFGSRVAGKVVGSVALGTTLQQTVYTTSRFLLVPFLPILGYLVESGISINLYIQIVIISFIFSFLIALSVIFNLNNLQHFYQTLFRKFTLNTIPVAFIKAVLTKKETINLKDCDNFSVNKIIFKKTFVSFLAYLFLTTGFFMAFALAIIFPENRLTLSQFTATFHGLGAVIFAFYLDPMLSRSIDTKKDTNDIWLKNVYSILLGRALSYFLIIILLISYLLIKNLFY